MVGSPDLESLTTSHIERAFLTTRQELKRFERKTLGYSKSVEMRTSTRSQFISAFTISCGNITR